MNKKVKEKYKISFAEMAVSFKGNNKFLGISIESPTLDHSTISRFRKILLIKDLYNKLFKEVNKQLVNKKLIVKNGAIVDATVITSARRPRKTIKGELAVDRKEDEF